MNWTQILQQSLDTIESCLEQPLDISELARQAHLSPFYYQKVFSLLCGMPPAEYIRKRRLARAALELVSSDIRIIDLALKYGYESPDSFTRAFSRFHGSTPSQVRNGRAWIRSFDPLHIELIVKGGQSMDYRIENYPAIDLVGTSKNFSYDQPRLVTQFWNDLHADPDNRIMGMFGISHDPDKSGIEFEYTIADPWDPAKLTGSAHRLELPAHQWAIFPARGFSPERYQELNERIFREWLPNHPYEIAQGYMIERYDDPSGYVLGMADPEYLFELWIPIRPRQ